MIPKASQKTSYADAIALEWERQLPFSQVKRLSRSILAAARRPFRARQIAAILDDQKWRLALAEDCEITDRGQPGR